jgi:DNA-binding HxlR family transcriptional regulator
MSSTHASADEAVAEANADVCSVVRAIDEIGSQWRLIVLNDLLAGEEDAEKRFNELKRSTNASSRTLSRVLDDLEEAGLVNRRVEDRPLATYYRLSERGRALCPVFDELERWTDEWLAADG